MMLCMLVSTTQWRCAVRWVLGLIAFFAHQVVASIRLVSLFTDLALTLVCDWRGWCHARPQVFSVGGHDWAIFQFRVVRISPDAPPPAPPKPVWGPLDPQGRTYGFTTNPASLAPSADAAGPPQVPEYGAQPGVAMGAPPPHMAVIQEEPSQAASRSLEFGESYAADGGQRGVSGGGDGARRAVSPQLQRNPAPMRLGASDDSISLGGGDVSV